MARSRTVIERNKRIGFLQIHPNLLMNNFRVVYVHEGPLGQKVIDESNSRRFTCITSVGLESETKYSDTLMEKMNKRVIRL